jgi:2-desacetyl-2-hydroxyethyl bacteriochlorophyllide A dehydrogenase
MKAAVVERINELRVKEVETPQPGPGEVLVEVKACGVCGTDVHVLDGNFPADFPIIPGHELSGQVVAVGENTRSVQVGDRVAIQPNLSCGACDSCRAGKPHFCSDFMGVGTKLHGGFAEYILCPEVLVHRFPEHLSYEDASFAEPLSCCLHGLDLLQLVPGENCLVIGAGSIGLLMTQLLLHGGASTVTVVERSEAKRNLAEKFGAVGCADLQNLEGRTFENVIECVGNPWLMEQTITLAAPKGKILWFGVPAEEDVVKIHPVQVFRKELTIMGSFVNPFTFDRALALLAGGRLQVAEMNSHTYSLDDTLQAIADKRNSVGIRQVVLPNK